jgi:glutamate dehydrogenase (NADP+)
MVNIFNACKENAEKYGCAGNYVAGANLAAFDKLAEAMKCQGIV